MSDTPHDTARRREVTGRHVLIGMIGFFGVVLLVNAVLTWLALDSFSGVETPDAYQKGLAYNEVLQAAERQAGLGWQVTLEPLDRGDGRLELEASFKDRYGEPIGGLEIAVQLLRPTNEGQDLEATLGAAARGSYRAELALPASGLWDLRLTARRGGATFYVLERRLWLS